MNFRELLADLQKLIPERKISQTDIAKILNVARSTYNQYEQQYDIIPIKHLNILVNHFKISFDYIFDFTELKRYKDEINEIDTKISGDEAKEITHVKSLILEVVEDAEGTAHDMKVSGRTIAGKTGTAELKGSKDAEADVLSWFDCFTADSNGNQLLVISMVENGRDLGGSHYLIPKIKTLFQ